MNAKPASRKTKSRLSEEKLIISAARKFGIKVERVDKEFELIMLKRGHKTVYSRSNVLDINSYLTSKIALNKRLVIKLLKKERLPVAKGYVGQTVAQALDIFRRKLKPPVVIKPNRGSMGNAVAVNIDSEADVKKAVQEVLEYNLEKRGGRDRFLMESFIKGQDYRFFVLDGRVLAVIKREPAFVVGDDRQTIKQLINGFNREVPSRQMGKIDGRKIFVEPIVFDYDLQRNLREQKLNLRHVPKMDEKIYLRQKANLSTGGRATECSDLAHQEFKKMAVKAAGVVGLRFCTVDFVAEDIKNPQRRHVIIEINEAPSIACGTYPYYGKETPIAEFLVKRYFSL